MDTSCSAHRFVVVKGGKIYQIDLSPFLLFSNFNTFKRWIKFTVSRLFCFDTLVILDVARCYLWLFTLDINIQIGKNSC